MPAGRGEGGTIDSVSRIFDDAPKGFIHRRSARNACLYFRGPGRVLGVTADATGANLPARFAPWVSFKSVELNRDKPNPGVGPGECLDDIEKHGFHITDAHIRIVDQVV